jgi:hypothetical protein
MRLEVLLREIKSCIVVDTCVSVVQVNGVAKLSDADNAHCFEVCERTDAGKQRSGIR